MVNAHYVTGQRDASRVGDWMQTISGTMFYPLDPRPEEMDVYDIAHALSNLCRFGGHIRSFYSVAQHSVYVSLVVPQEHALAGLMHDATEAYCVDMPRPIKQHLPAYEAIEERLWLSIAERFRLPVELPPCVKDADNAVLLAEKQQLLARSPAPWSVNGEPAPITIGVGMTPENARRAFLARYAEIVGGML